MLEWIGRLIRYVCVSLMGVGLVTAALLGTELAGGSHLDARLVVPAAVATELPRPRGNPGLPACEGCGCKGGPGYRKPNGDCVSWKQIFTVCGSPPSKCCTPEQADPRAPTIAAKDAARPRAQTACRK